MLSRSLLRLWLPNALLLFLLVGCNLVKQVEGSGASETPQIVVTSESIAPPFVEEEPIALAPPSVTPDPAEMASDAPATLTDVAPSAPPPPTPAATVTTPPVSTATPILAPRLFRLTSGGCCTQPVWSPDSTEVRFIDKPAADLPVGIWGVPVAQPDASPGLVTEEISSYARDSKFLVETGRTTAVIERLADGSRWEVRTQGDTPSISPDGTRIAWDVRDRGLPWDQQVAEIWVAAIDGSGAQQVLTLSRGSVRGWLSDDLLLLSGRDSPDAEEQRVFTLSLQDGTTTDLVRTDRLRGELLSPDGNWLAYYTAQSVDPSRNGLWLVRTDGSEQYQLPDEFFGAYQWRDDSRLLLVPFRPDATFHELWELDATTKQLRQLTDPTQLPIKIANGDWRVSPDGRYVAFVESRDNNIWVVDLN